LNLTLQHYALKIFYNYHNISFIEGSNQFVSDDLFQSWSSELGIPIMPEGDMMLDYDKTTNEGVKNIFDLWTPFKEINFNQAQNNSGIYIYIRVILHTHTHTYIHIHTHIYTHTHTHTYKVLSFRNNYLPEIFIELEEIDEIRNEIKFEPESPIVQFPLSPNSLNHSESNDSDRQVKCSMQEVSNCTMQNIKAEVCSIGYIMLIKKYKNLMHI